MNDMMQQYMKQMSVGENHKLLAKMAGKWTTKTKVWGMPGMPAMESEGKAEAKLIFDGRFLVEETEGKIMGMPSKMMNILGYDNAKRVYNYTFYSNMGTATNSSSGILDEASKTLNLKGEMDDFAGKRIVRHVIRIESEDLRVFESYDTLPDGKEFKVMETAFTREK